MKKKKQPIDSTSKPTKNPFTRALRVDYNTSTFHFTPLMLSSLYWKKNCEKRLSSQTNKMYSQKQRYYSAETSPHTKRPSIISIFSRNDVRDSPERRWRLRSEGQRRRRRPFFKKKIFQTTTTKTNQWEQIFDNCSIIFNSKKFQFVKVSLQYFGGTLLHVCRQCRHINKTNTSRDC